MNINIITDTAAINQKEWEWFVYDHPHGNIFQTYQMYTAYNETENYQPIVVAGYKGDSLVGILLAVVQKEYKGILGKLSARSIIWGGPLVRDNDIHVLDAIMNEYDQIVKKKAIYSQIRNIFSMEWANSKLLQLRYCYEEHLNYLINVSVPVEEIWKQLHPTRRKQIERGYRRGAELRLISNPENALLSECYDLIVTTYKRIKLPIPKKDFIENAMNIFPKNLGLFTLEYQENIIGCRFVLLFKKMIYDWYAGSDSKFLDKYPNDILPWEIMKWGAENDYNVFDFGGAGKPGVSYGVRDFKSKFGGELVNFGRFQKTHKPITMYIAKLGFRLWQILIK